MTPRAKMVLILAGVMVGIAFLFLGRTSAPEAPETLRIGAFEGDVGALAWIAAEQGFFKQVGLNAELKGFDTGKASVDALRKGEVDVAMASEFVAADLSFTEPDLRVLASVCQYWNKGLIGRHDRGIAGPADLRGKRIGVALTSTSEHTLVVFLALQGLTADDVQLVNLPPKQLVEQMESGAIDAAITWQPHVGTIERRLGANAIQLLPRGADAYLLALTREETAHAKSKAFGRYLQALLLAEEWIRANPERARAWLAQRFSLDPAYVARLWPDMRLAVTLPQEILEIMDGEARWLATKKDAQTLPDFSRTLHAAPLAAVRPAAVTVFAR
jgi:NitT/TauT family transport system substrate-binding protein